MIRLDFADDFAHPAFMTHYPWNADAAVFQYPPLSASATGEPIVLLHGTLRDCFQKVADLDDLDRLNIEIETIDGEALYNAMDIERIIANGGYR